MPAPIKILQQYWGHKAFRPLQADIVQSILNGKDTVALLPTGGGKSVCYQVPAIINDGFCLVISPLIALMQDQVSRLHELGIMAECIHSGMHYNDVKRTLENMIHGPYKLLYVSPERLQTELFKEYLPAMNISFIAVDEAHCISQWGHDFRPDYLKIAWMKQVFHNIPVLALTASATTVVQADIILQLKLNQPAIFRQSFRRGNITYDIRYTENKNRDLLQHFDDHAGSSIVYCRSRRQTESLVKYLSQHNIAAIHYHAGMAKNKREEAQDAWISGKVQHMIATTAFGMGIDKANVRSVVHFDAPEHIEAFYQESGRAGRDGNPAYSLVLYNSIDIKRLHDSIALQYPPAAYLRQVYQSVVEYLQIAIGTEPHRYYAFDLQDFCRKFKLEALAASNALKLLQQEGLWTITESVFKPATVQFTTDRATLDSLYGTYPQLGAVATALLRLHGNVLSYPATIRIGALAKQAKQRREETEQHLANMHAMGIIDYRKSLEGPQLFFHHYRVDSRHLIIDLQRIHVLRERHKARTESIIAFLQNRTDCRTAQILTYFDERAENRCGNCDVCFSNLKRKTEIAPDLKTRILAYVQENRQVSPQSLASKFSPAIREDVMTLIRKLIDDRELRIYENGMLSVI